MGYNFVSDNRGLSSIVACLLLPVKSAKSQD